MGLRQILFHPIPKNPILNMKVLNISVAVFLFISFPYFLFHPGDSNANVWNSSPVHLETQFCATELNFYIPIFINKIQCIISTLILKTSSARVSAPESHPLNSQCHQNCNQIVVATAYKWRMSVMDSCLFLFFLT